MGQSHSLLALAWERLRDNFFDYLHNFSLISPKVGGLILGTHSFKKTSETKTEAEAMTVSDESNKSSRLKDCKPENVVLDRSLSFKEMLGVEVRKNELQHKPMPALAVSQPEFMFSPRPVTELDAAAVTLQKVYRSYRTRRNLADCAVVAEELWWRTVAVAELEAGT